MARIDLPRHDCWGGFAALAGARWGDRWGPATRIPALIISPSARRGYVDHTAYDTSSIQKLINARFGLEPLPGLPEKIGDLTNALDRHS